VVSEVSKKRTLDFQEPTIQIDSHPRRPESSTTPLCECHLARTGTFELQSFSLCREVGWMEALCSRL